MFNNFFLLVLTKLYIMDTNELFELAEMLDNDIAHIEKKFNDMQTQLFDLKAYREHIQKGIESAIDSMESNTGE